MSKNINARIALKRDTAANWQNSNPVILNGELILVDTNSGELRAKIGDGVKTYTQLPFSDEALRALITEVDNNNSAVVITKNGETRLLDTFNVIKLTSEEYKELLENDLIDPDALYLTEGDGNEEEYSKVVLKDLINNSEDEVLETLNIIRLSQEEYDDLALNNLLDPQAIYLTEGYNSGVRIFVTDNGVSNEVDKFEVIKLTQHEYDTLVDSGLYNSDTLYVITDQLSTTAFVVNTVNELRQYVDTTTENFTTEINQDINDFNTQVNNTINNFTTEVDQDINNFNSQVNTKISNFTTEINQDISNFTTEINTIIDDLREEIQGGAYLPLTGGTVTGVTTFSNTTASSSTTTGAVKISGGLGVAGDIYANKVYGAVWNDYAECREATEFCEAGRAVKENGDDTISLTDGRLVYGASLVSDTFGFLIGETEKAKTPIAVSGRVLAYTYENREVFRYNIGHFVCSGPHGTVSLMDKEEVWNHPEAIIGQVSAVPDYEYWENDVKVDGRVWIKVR